MSGIVAVFNPEGTRTSIGDMAKRLPSHATGRDEWRDPHFGAVRFHHGVIHTGAQPAWDEPHDLCLFMDGELFATADGELAAEVSPVDQCLATFRDDPESFASFNGSFALIVYDKRQRTMSLVSDRINTRPLYYFRSGSEIAVSSHIAALTAHPRCPKTLNRQTLHELITYRQVLGDNTIYEGIKWIAPGSVVTFDGTSETVRRYWKLRWQEPSFRKAELPEALANGFRRAVNRRLARNARHGLLLSGGLDSRMILAAADKPVVCATLGDIETDQVRCARQAAAIKGADHHFLPVDADAFWENFEEGVRLTGGMYGYQQNHFLPVLDRVRQLCQIAFTGNYLDTTLRATFMPQRKVKIAGVTVGLPSLARIKGDDLVGAIVGSQKQAFAASLVHGVLTPDAAAEHEDRLRQGMTDALRGFESIYPYNAWNWLVFRSISRNFAFPNVASIRSRMDVTVVAWDHDLLDVALQTPPEWCCPDTSYRQALRVLSPELAELDYANEGMPANANPYVRTAMGILQGSLRSTGRRWLDKRPVKGPASWLDFDRLIRQPGPLCDQVRALPYSDAIAACGIFDPAGIEAVVEQHLQRKLNAGKFLLMLLTIDNWITQFGAAKGHETVRVVRSARETVAKPVLQAS